MYCYSSVFTLFLRSRFFKKATRIKNTRRSTREKDAQTTSHDWIARSRAAKTKWKLSKLAFSWENQPTSHAMVSLPFYSFSFHNIIFILTRVFPEELYDLGVQVRGIMGIYIFVLFQLLIVHFNSYVWSAFKTLTYSIALYWMWLS